MTSRITLITAVGGAALMLAVPAAWGKGQLDSSVGAPPDVFERAVAAQQGELSTPIVYPTRSTGLWRRSSRCSLSPAPRLTLISECRPPSSTRTLPRRLRACSGGSGRDRRHSRLRRPRSGSIRQAVDLSRTPVAPSSGRRSVPASASACCSHSDSWSRCGTRGGAHSLTDRDRHSILGTPTAAYEAAVGALLPRCPGRTGAARFDARSTSSFVRSRSSVSRARARTCSPFPGVRRESSGRHRSRSCEAAPSVGSSPPTAIGAGSRTPGRPVGSSCGAGEGASGSRWRSCPRATRYPSCASTTGRVA